MAEPVNFTVAAIEALTPPASGRLEVKDTKAPGLYLRVTSTGVKSFSFVGRAKGSSRVERVTLGKYPAVRPEEARRRAMEIAGQLAGGKSVASAERQRRGELNVEELKAEYARYLHQTAKRPDTFEAMYRLYIKPAFGTRKLSEVRATDVERWFHALPEQVLKAKAAQAAERQANREQRRKEVAARQQVRRHGPDPKPAQPAAPNRKVTGQRTANAAIEALRSMFNWAMKPKYGLFQGVNPASGHKLFPKVQRERFLQPSELGPFFEALAQEPNIAVRDCILTKLLTGARRSNVHQMRWADVDLGRAEWRIPGEKTKNGDAQTVPLVDEALSLLKSRKETATSEYVFPASSSLSKLGYVNTTAKAWKRVLQRANLVDIVEHDLRRTLGSWQARTGASLILIGKSLNHRDSKSTQIYARLDTDPVRQSVTRATSAMFEAAGIKPAAQVIPLPATAAKAAKSRKS